MKEISLHELAANASSSRLVASVAEALCRPAAHYSIPVAGQGAVSMPSLAMLHELMDRLRAALFPGYYGSGRVVGDSLRYHMAANLDSIFCLLKKQIHRGYCFMCDDNSVECQWCEDKAHEGALRFMEQLPTIRDLLASDVKAAFEGDPAAKSPAETIFCYPSIAALTHHRIAHALYSLEVPLIPRIISEMGHGSTGIDIHPGATIGEEFFIDHGTGVVIGETCVLGKRCRLYQGVTLGALSFQKDDQGVLVKGQPRHPVLEDGVTVYAGATILGRITIGSGSIIGGNVWLTHSVPPHSRIVQQRSTQPTAAEDIVGKPSS